MNMENNMNLYEIDRNIKEIIENGFSFNEETGEILFETEDLEKLEMSLNDKINNIVGFIKDLDIQADNYKKVSEDYKSRSDSKKKKAEHLKKYLSDYLQANDMTDKKEFKNGVTSFRKSQSLSITNDIDLIKYLQNNDEFGEYLRTKYEFDKTGLKKEIKDGKEIPFCEIIENNNLQIK